MALTIKRAAALVLLTAVIGAVAIYATAKPYQQDRILIELGLKAP